MANQEALAILKQGVKIWNVWRAGSGSAILISRDLRDADMGGANLRDVDLSYTDLSHANLGSANLGSANLSSALQPHFAQRSIERVVILSS